MINDIMFFDIYTIIYVSLCFLCLLNIVILRSGKKLPDKFNNYMVILYFTLITILFSLRDIRIGTDTGTYLRLFHEFSELNVIGLGLDALNSDIGFILFIKLISVFGQEYFLFFCALLYIYPIFFILLKIKCDYKLFFILCVFSMFFFLSLGINIMRQGIALSFMILGIYFDTVSKKKQFVFFSLLACSFHSSVILILILYMLTKRFLGLKIVSTIFIIAVFLSLFGITLINRLGDYGLLSSLYDSRLMSYVESDNSVGYKIGFRYDFFLFNMFYLLVGAYFIRFKKAYVSVLYVHIFKTYILLTSVFVIMFNFPYSDRFGVLSWVFIPYILSPFVINKALVKKAIIPFVVLNVLIFVIFKV